MAKRVTEILFPVAKDTDLAPNTFAATPANLTGATDGAYLIIDEDTQAAATATSRKIYMLVKCTDAAGRPYLKRSFTIEKGTVTSYNRSLFSAATAKVQTSGAFPTPVNGTEYVLFIANKEDDNYHLPRKRIAVVADSSITTAALLRNAFVTAVNEFTNEIGVTAPASGAAAMTFTGTAIQGATTSITNNTKTADQVLFSVIMSDGLETVTITNTTNPDPGIGEGYKIRELEEFHKGYQASLNNVFFANLAYNFVYQSSLTSNYDVVAIEHQSRAHTNSEGSVPNEKVTVIAATTGGILANGAALTVDLETTINIDADWF